MNSDDIARREMRLRLERVIPVPAPDRDQLQRTEWSREFETLMRNRLIVGGIRYGPMNGDKPSWDYAAEGIKRLTQFQKTGNREILVDVANMCALEFEARFHPKSHWKSTDHGTKIFARRKQ